jgi:general stress protein 26
MRKISMADEVIKIRELLKSFDTAMLITRGEESPFHARPTAIAKVEEDCDVWFFTARQCESTRN